MVKKSMKKILAIVSCIAVVMASICINDPIQSGVQAADSRSTMSITSADTGFKLVSAGGTGESNMYYTGVPSDYLRPGANFLDATFIEKYITFGGGMTAADLLEGHTTFYVATNSILQFKWASRTTAFTEGWSFTIAKGALLPYTTASGTSYMALDKEYTFTFKAGNATRTNIIQISSVDITTWSLPTEGLFGTGKSADTATNFQISGSDIGNSSINTKYTPLQTDAQYAAYIDFNGTAFSSLTEKGVIVRSVFEGNTKCIQVEKWGDLRNDFKVGYQVVFREGMPIYYTTSDGTTWKALLDGTYVYEGMYRDASHDVVFSGAKVDETASISIKTNANYPTGTTTFVNVGFVATENVVAPSGYIGEDFLADHLSGCYIDLSGCSADLRANEVTFKYIPTANTIQLAFGATAKALLKAGDTIVFRAGMPIVYNTQLGNEAACVVLDDEYTFRVVSNDGTNVVMSWELTGDYSLSGRVSGRASEGNPSCYYYNFYLGNDAVWGDSNSQFQGTFTDNAELLEKYFVSSTATAEEMKSEGWMLRRYYLPGTLIGLRFYCPESCWDFETGDYVIFKKGLPVSYTTTSNKPKTTYLDKDYGFVYDSSTSTFVYDESLVSEPEDTPPDVTPPDDTVVPFAIPTNDLGTGVSSMQDANSLLNILDVETGANNVMADAVRKYDPLSANTIEEYVDFFGMSVDEMTSHGVSIRFIKDGATEVLQILWGTSMDALENGDELVFKKGLPYTYTTQSGGTKTIVLDQDYTFVVHDGNASNTKILKIKTATEDITKKEWSLENGAIYNTALGVGGEGYYNNISIGSCEMTEDLSSLRVTLDATTMAEYLDFAGIEPTQYTEHGIQAIVVIDGNTKVVQLRWGDTTSLVEAGDEIIFKKGMPIAVASGGAATVYELDADYVFTISEHADGANGYRITTTKMDDFNISITVDSVEVVNDLYRTGTKLDLEQYRNTAVGKVMSIQINGVATQDTSFVVSEDATITILNRSDICVVVFRDEGVTVATREYMLTDENIDIPYAPDKDGYDDSWEKFELVNGVIYVDAIHTVKASSQPVIQLDGVVIEKPSASGESGGAASPQTGDNVTVVPWLVISAAALLFIILKTVDKNKTESER